LFTTKKRNDKEKNIMDVDHAEHTSSERESKESINMDFEHANCTNSADKAESKSINMNCTNTPIENHDTDESKSESESKNDTKSNFQHIKHTSCHTAEEESDQETLELPDDPPMLIPRRAETPSLVPQDQDQSPPRSPPKTL
jgi:hypothetical protein